MLQQPTYGRDEMGCYSSQRMGEITRNDVATYVWWEIKRYVIATYVWVR